MAIRAEDVEPLVPRVPAVWWDGFDDPPGMRAEVIRGELVLSPSASRRHQRAVKVLLAILDAQCPKDHEALPDLEWRFDHHGLVARAPRPDVAVVPRGEDGPLQVAPLLAVEVLSPADQQMLLGTPVRRVDGKLRDYADNGLQHYLEISLDLPGARLFRLSGAHKIELVVDATGDSLFRAEEPFLFSFHPAELS